MTSNFPLIKHHCPIKVPMFLARKSNAKAFPVLGLCLLLAVSDVHGTGRSILHDVFDVVKFGADASGKTDSTACFVRAWNAACGSSGPAKVVIPRGTYRTGNMDFVGPCKASPIAVDIQGTILAENNIKDKESFLISKVKNLIVTGAGTYDGQGALARNSKGCKGKSCQSLPVSMKFAFVTDGRVENINLRNSKGFHMTITNCTNFIAQGLHLVASKDYKNTDGIHISRSKHVIVTRCVISTGDDCVSIGEGSSFVEVNNIECGPGHGISIGSLGKVGDCSVSNVHVSRCKFKNTINGARIKTFQNSPKIEATNITFEDLTMENVQNPIIVDQHYHAGGAKKPSLVQLRDIHFRNIRGTTNTAVAVSLNCSSSAPCQDVELVNIDLKYVGTLRKNPFSGACENAHATFSGKQSPPAPVCK